MISSTMEQPSPCTGENNPKGSSMRKLTTRVQKLCLEVRLMNVSRHFFMDTVGVVIFCFYEPIGSFSPVQGDLKAKVT